jgi:hypothetical protein
VRWRAVLVPAVIFFVAAAATLYAAATRQAQKAADLLVSLTKVDLVQLSFSDVQDLRKRFGDLAKSSDPCTAESCDVGFSVRNAVMHKFRLAPRTELTVLLQIRNDRLAYGLVSMFVISNIDRGHDVGAWTQVFPRAEREMPAFSLGYKHGFIERWEAVAQLRPGATPAERALAFDYNTACLERLGGCKSSGDIVPRWWELKSPPSKAPPE